MDFSVPKRRVTRAVKTENIPKHRMGIVVSRPRRLLDSPVSARISPISGPMPVRGGLRLSEIRITAAKSSIFD